jgi:hypothetical protein
VDEARKRARNDKGSLVDKISNKDWEALTKESCIQCDKTHLEETSEDELRLAYEKEALKPLGEVPEGIRRSIISAICASKSFSEAEKTLYTT